MVTRGKMLAVCNQCPSQLHGDVVGKGWEQRALDTVWVVVFVPVRLVISIMVLILHL